MAIHNVNRRPRRASGISRGQPATGRPPGAGLSSPRPARPAPDLSLLEEALLRDADDVALDAARETPTQRITLYRGGLITSTWYHPDGTVQRAYPIAAAELRARASQRQADSGPLPPNTWRVLFRATSRILAIYLPPRVRQLRYQAREGAAIAVPRLYSLPLPGLLWVAEVGAGSDAHRLFALTGRPNDDDTSVYACPLFNVDPRTGNICFGTVQPPSIEVAGFDAVARTFFESHFSGSWAEGKSRAHPRDLLAVWTALEGKKRYPTSDLAPVTTLGGVLGVRKGDI